MYLEYSNYFIILNLLISRNIELISKFKYILFQNLKLSLIKIRIKLIIMMKL